MSSRDKPRTMAEGVLPRNCISGSRNHLAHRMRQQTTSSLLQMREVSRDLAWHHYLEDSNNSGEPHLVTTAQQISLQVDTFLSEYFEIPSTDLYGNVDIGQVSKAAGESSSFYGYFPSHNFDDDWFADEGQPQSQKSPENELKLFFKPLDKRTTKDGVQSVLSRYGTISYLRVPFSKKKNKNLGYGFVVFEDQQVAHSILLMGKQISIEGKMVSFEIFASQKHQYKQTASEVTAIDPHFADLWSLERHYFDPCTEEGRNQMSRDPETVLLQGNRKLVPNKEVHSFWCIKPTVSLYHKAHAQSGSQSTKSYRFNVGKRNSFATNRLIKPNGGQP